MIRVHVCLWLIHVNMYYVCETDHNKVILCYTMANLLSTASISTHSYPQCGHPDRLSLLMASTFIRRASFELGLSPLSSPINLRPSVGSSSCSLRRMAEKSGPPGLPGDLEVVDVLLDSSDARLTRPSKKERSELSWPEKETVPN